MVPAGIWKTLLASESCSSEGGSKIARALVSYRAPGLPGSDVVPRRPKNCDGIVVPSALEYQGSGFGNAFLQPVLCYFRFRARSWRWKWPQLGTSLAFINRSVIRFLRRSRLRAALCHILTSSCAVRSPDVERCLAFTAHPCQLHGRTVAEGLA